MNFDKFLLETANSKLLSPKYIPTLMAVFRQENHGKSILKCHEQFLDTDQSIATTENYLKEIYKFFWSKHPDLNFVEANGYRKALTDYFIELYKKQENRDDKNDRLSSSNNDHNIQTTHQTEESKEVISIECDSSAFLTSITTSTTDTSGHNRSSIQDMLKIERSISSSWMSEKSYNKFIARENELTKLIKHMEGTVDNKILSIWGMGGLGKTATCHRLISLLYQQKRFKEIVWVNAKRKQFQTSEGKSEQIRESRLDIQDAILDIGKELNLDAWFVQDLDRLRHEISDLFKKESYLLVIDGLEDTESPKLLISDLRKILGKSSLFLTSRKQVGLENGLEYRLPVLDEQSSCTFIQQMIIEKCADDPTIGQQIIKNIEKVIAATHGMPLAMKLLVSQAKFLGLERVLERLNSVVEEEEFYLYLYWEVYQELCKENQIDALKIMIFLAN